MVLFKRGVDAATEVDRLEARYRFTADDVWDAVGGFFVEDITPPIVARLRCEPSVSAVDHDGIASVGTE